ncbi:(2Fe-2S)-binding protein [Algoriphagus chordae]|uniref:Nicotinate dehydrogenase subunit A n=1 Tax=Algoriphagus chordae TaxID=237019 RepID=A0A2W7R9H4_9BACT|nr:(2Fe-2S)-binding protein [Algoriphagus chordae]PZX55786.1 nicotinate dehydrogenase subunit A [Algoriphagus chordae]
MPKYTLHINGTQKVIDTEADTPLLYALRDYLQLNGPKFGCGLSQCGACMVLKDGKAVTSCLLPIASIGNSEIITLEGLVESNGKMHALQEAFIKEQAAQCGYCLNGMLMAATGLLNENPRPTDTEIKEALELNLCRCSAHTRIIKAIKSAAKNQTGP